ncbi:MAG: hypothetical protein PHS95_01480 [Candidatus Pacebacteria bacterium]|nr:hypothetical protein [Candidatus Paceibacterota bacterium]
MLEKLRAKSDNVKRGIALVVSGIIFSIISVVWISSKKAEASPTETLSPLAGFMTIFQNFANDVKNIGSQMPSYGDSEMAGGTATTTTKNTATSTQNVDTSGIVIIDSANTAR